MVVLWRCMLNSIFEKRVVQIKSLVLLTKQLGSFRRFQIYNNRKRKKSEMNNNNENWVQERVEVSKPMNCLEQTTIEGMKKKICSKTRWYGEADGFYEIFKSNSIFNTKAIKRRILSGCFSFLSRFNIHIFRHLARLCVCIQLNFWKYNKTTAIRQAAHTHTPLLALFC